jgi:hypothetical protein
MGDPCRECKSSIRDDVSREPWRNDADFWIGVLLTIAAGPPSQGLEDIYIHRGVELIRSSLSDAWELRDWYSDI